MPGKIYTQYTRVIVDALLQENRNEIW